MRGVERINIAAGGSRLRLGPAIDRRDDLNLGESKTAVNEPSDWIVYLDYGAIDYFLVDGNAVVVDANMTTGANAEWLKRYAFRREFNDHVAERLIDFVRR